MFSDAQQTIVLSGRKFIILHWKEVYNVSLTVLSESTTDEQHGEKIKRRMLKKQEKHQKQQQEAQRKAAEDSQHQVGYATSFLIGMNVGICLMLLRRGENRSEVD